MGDTVEGILPVEYMGRRRVETTAATDKQRWPDGSPRRPARLSSLAKSGGLGCSRPYPDVDRDLVRGGC